MPHQTGWDRTRWDASHSLQYDRESFLGWPNQTSASDCNALIYVMYVSPEPHIGSSCSECIQPTHWVGFFPFQFSRLQIDYQPYGQQGTTPPDHTPGTLHSSRLRFDAFDGEWPVCGTAGIDRKRADTFLLPFFFPSSCPGSSVQG